ncbi:MAG: tRNA pseudouridine(38-40) synthase TruA [bacterium]|nr:tRNA pseudouridine(38-40) synthase TruA [bacterium]
MQNIKLALAYDGTNYHGFATQPDGNTVSDTLKKALAQLTSEEIKLITASRTDAGVHAKCQVVNFLTNSTIPIESFPKAINSRLPEDIVVYGACQVSDSFHARFSAKFRRYRYSILTAKYPDVFSRRYTYWVPWQLHLEDMRQATNFLAGTHDFSAFASEVKSVKNPVRNVEELSIAQEGAFIHFDFKANAFLHGMIRTIVGTLLDVGREKLTPKEVKDILESKDRANAGALAPPQGLCLMEVGY